MKNERFYDGAKKYDLERTFKRHAKTLSTDDEMLIRRYINEKQATKHITDTRARKIGVALVGWKRFIEKPWTEISYDDVLCGIKAMKKGLAHKGFRDGRTVECGPLKPNTQHDFVVILKPWLRWLNDEGIISIPEKKIKELQPPAGDTQVVKACDILTPDEITAMIKAAHGERDRALICVLYESGVRAGELGRLTWADVIFDDYGVKLYISDTKTKKRRYSRLTLSTEALASLKNHYLGPAEGDRFVFVNSRGESLSYVGMFRVVQRTAARAGITKNVKPHLLRHSRITHMITLNYQESVIKESMWGNLSTNMFKTYVSLSEQDIDKEFLKRAGITVTENRKEDVLKPRPCGRCHFINPPTLSFCGKCGLALTGEVAEKFKQAQEQAELQPEYNVLLEKFRAELVAMQTKKADT